MAKATPPRTRITPMNSRLWGLPQGMMSEDRLATAQTARRRTPRTTSTAPWMTCPRSIFTGNLEPYSSMNILT